MNNDAVNHHACVNEGVVRVTRGGYTECLHRFHLSAVDRNGRDVLTCGDAQFFTCMRSSAKPLQAIPVVLWGVDEQYNLSERELAALCGSLNGEDFQVDVVRSILGKAGIGEDGLKCGAQLPSYRKAAEKVRQEGGKAAPIYHNCAAKHAGMLIACKSKGFDMERYLEPAHPLQQEILTILADYAELGRDEIKTVVDGCGLPVFFMPLKSIAVAYKNLALKMENRQSRVKKLIAAALNNPDMIGGTERLCTDVIKATEGRIFAKVGADGVYAAFNTASMEAVAIKVEDGAARALNPLFVAALERMGWLEKKELPALQRYRNVPVKNSRGDVVGAIDVAIR